MKVFLGLDCGSVSMKLVLMDKKGGIVEKLYLRNQGIIDTLKIALKKGNVDDYEIMSVGCTGSGRQLLGLLLGAGTIKTEVLAHTIGALHCYPKTRTILDIGGEDCKIICVHDGVMENFILNNICGAGTGSVIEAIASRLGIRIEDVGSTALKSTQRLNFSGKCGIFCQSSVVTKLNNGARKDDILMGVIRALVKNYLFLAKSIRLEPPFVFQGMTAKNDAVVKALEEQLGSKVFLPYIFESLHSY